MKRSERLFSEARHNAWLSLLILMVSVAIGCWSARVTMSTPLGGVAMLGLALVGFASFVATMLEAIRLARLAGREAEYEHEREVRPRL